ncbi:MAG: Fe-S cluster assembly protein SufD [Proteobacteria bacterium]|nr:Fe-S cluster assembly protein SufD [Pseudomonadota bacterium]
MGSVVENAAAYVAAQQDTAAQLPGYGLAALDAGRAAALEQLSRHGLPSQQDEDWKYTSTRSITRAAFKPASAGAPCPADFITQSVIEGLNPYRMVFVDGFLSAALSDLEALPGHVRLRSLAQVLSEDATSVVPSLGRMLGDPPHGFAAMNSAFVADGAVVEIEAHQHLERPIELLFVSGCGDEGLVSMPRTLVLMGEGSHATIIERHCSLKEVRSLNNSLVEIDLGKGATLDYCSLQSQSNRSFHVGGLFAGLAESATLRATTVSTSGALIRNDARINLNGENSTVHLDGCYLVFGRSHVDNHTHISHNSANCVSRETYKGVLGDRGRAVFHGRIVVKQDAQKTDSEQSNQNLLLSEEAEIDTKPQLEIYADDVKCAHGATVGQLDDLALFYLVSRGVKRENARRMLTQAFAADVLDRVESAPLRQYLQSLASDRLSNALSTSGAS